MSKKQMEESVSGRRKWSKESGAAKRFRQRRKEISDREVGVTVRSLLSLERALVV